MSKEETNSGTMTEQKQPSSFPPAPGDAVNYSEEEQDTSDTESTDEHSQTAISSTTFNVTTSADSVVSTTELHGLSGFSNAAPRDSTQRPAALRKTRRRPSFQAEQVSPELRPVLHLFDIYSRKVYIEGYLCKQDQNGLYDKRKPSAYDWEEFYVELCGPVLSLWKATKNLDIAETVAPRPTVINVSHSIVESLGTVSDGIYVFWLDAGEGDQYYFQAQNATLLNKWVLAIRLSCFEGSRLQEVYTATLFRRPGFRESLAGTSLVKGKFEGHLQVRFTGTKAWKKYWVVVSDHRLEDKKKKDLAFTRGQITFYETKKSKKQFMTMANVLSAFAIYPEVPSMIDKTTHFRVEGNIFPAQVTDNKPGDYVLLMAETPAEMAKWMVGFFDSFKLYGRPKELLYNFNDPVSPLFGVPMTKSNTKLFLDIPEVEHVDMGQSLADVKAEFAEVLRKMHEQKPDKLETEEENDPSSSRPRSKPSVQIPPQIITSGLYENSPTRQRSNGSTVSTPSSGSPSLKATPQLMRPPSLLAQHSPAKGSPTATIGSQKLSIRDSKEVQPTSEKRISQNTRMAHTTNKQGKPRKGRQLASSDEDEDDDDNEDSKDETESDTDSEVDDLTLLKNTQANAKTINSPIKLNLLQSEGQSESTTTESRQLETTAFESSGIDLMSEIMTSFSERKENDEETPTPTTTKPKRSVSFKNPPKLKSKHKQNLTPVPSNSEEESDSEEGKTTSSEGEKDNGEKDDQEEEEATNGEDGKKGKETKFESPVSPKTVEKSKKKKVKVIPQPSDSEEEENGEEAPLGLQLQAAPRTKRRELSPRRDLDPYDDKSYPYDYRQPYSYGQYGNRSQQVPYMDRGGSYSPSYPNHPSYPYSSNQSYSATSSHYPPVRISYATDDYNTQDKDDHVPLGRGPVTTRKQVLNSKSARNEKQQGTSKGKKPIKRAQSIEGSDDESTENEEEASSRDTEESEASETENRNESSSKGKEKEISNAVKENYDKPVGDDLGIYLPTVNLDLNFDTLKLDSIDKNTNEGLKEKDESAERSSSSSDSGAEDVVKPRRTFKPTKRKDKSKTTTRKSSDSSNSNSSISQSSSHEPLFTIVPAPDDPPLPYSRGYNNTPPRSVSPSYQYYDNEPRSRNSYMGYPPSDNRKGMLTPLREYDDDYMAGGMSGRPRLNTPPGRRRVSGSQADYQRDMYYYEEDDRVDYPRSTRLSAREQEYLAREAGVPLIQIEEKPKDPESGLVGHITARERQRKLMGPNIVARQLELERENERRFYERQQYDLPSPTGDPRSSRFYGNQQHLDAGGVGNSRRNSYYDNFGSYEEDENDDDDDDDDVPLGVAPPSPALKQTRGPRGTRRRDTE